MPPRDWGVGRAREASAQPVHLLLAVGDLEGLRPRSQGQHGNRLLHQRRGFSQRAGLSENAGLPPPHRRRDLGHRLLPRRASARGQHADLSGRSTARLHRARVAIGKVRSKYARHGRYHSLPKGRREEKFAALDKLALDGDAWTDCPTDWRAPFLPAFTGAWATYPALEDLFAYNGSGVMPGRTWVIAPDAESLLRRWQALIKAKAERKEALFVPHLNHGVLGDRHVNSVVTKGLPGFPDNPKPIAERAGRLSAAGTIRIPFF